MNLAYEVEKTKSSKKISKFAIVNSIIGIPTMIFLIFLMVRGFLAEYLLTSSLALGVLFIGVTYSIYKIYTGISKNKDE